VFDLHRQGELLALTYSIGGLAVVTAWSLDPNAIGNRSGMAALLALVFAAGAVLCGLREHPPPYMGDIAIVGSLVLIDLGLFFTRLHSHPGLLGPFFVWVGVAAPLWFPRRRAILYVFLAIVASGVVIVVAGTAAAVAGWVITMATLIVAFCITSFLTQSLIERERLAVVGEMTSVVGHELRNPLGAVQNALFLLRLSFGREVSQDQAQQLQMAEREIRRAASIIDHLGAYVRPRQPVIAPTELGPLVAEVLEITPPHQGVEVSVDVAPIAVLADRGQLAEVLINMITNAYDAIGDQGSLRIGTSVKGSSAVIWIEDDGPGIDPALAERIFEPFYTAKPTGTGLGLAIVRRLAEANGGLVHLDRNASIGARFLIKVPFCRAPAGTLNRLMGATGSQFDAASRAPQTRQGQAIHGGGSGPIQPTSRPEDENVL